MQNLLILQSWRSLNAAISALSEEEVRQLLIVEVAAKGRARFIERLHQRYNSLRSDRERSEYLAKAKVM